MAGGMRPEADKMSSPLIKWTDFPNQIDSTAANAALLDYIDSALYAALEYRAGKFLSLRAYEAYKKDLRQEFNSKLLQITGAK